MMKRLGQITLGLIAGLLAIAAILAIGAYILIENSLPETDGVIVADGLTAPATIARDAAGIPVITASTREDLAFATGFAHGQDRFFQMDLTRRSSAGELSELFGAIALPRDRTKRWHRFRARALSALDHASDRDRSILAAYTKGVNAGLGSLSSKPFEYYAVDAEPAPWRDEDSMLVAYAMFMTLNDERAANDVGRGVVASVLPPEVYAWIYPTGTSWDAPMIGPARPTASVPTPDIFDFSTFGGRPTSDKVYTEDPLVGSNNWAVSGALTKTGRAIVANDMHLQITVPNVFYRVRLVIDGAIDITGLSLPGAPVIVAGSNGKVAWGFTNSYGDWSDAILLREGPEPGTYMTPDGPQAFEIYEEIIRVKNAEDDRFSVRETIWGPVLDDGSWPHGDVAVSWTAHDPEAVNMNHFDLETVGSVEDALRIASTMGMPAQNFVSGDADGNIGWTIAGRIPARREYDGRLPVDWSEESGWNGWLPTDAYPRILNPESGRIWTANTRVVDGDALTTIGFGNYALGARAAQIRDGLFASETFEPIDMLQIQNDDRAIFLQRWQKLLVDILSDDDRDQARSNYKTLVENWIPKAAPESVGYRLVRDFRLRVRTLVFDMLMTPVRDQYGSDLPLRIERQFEGPLWELVNQKPAHWLIADYDSWDALLQQAIDMQIDDYTQTYDDDIENRTWAERNTTAIRHPLSRAIPALSEWLDMPAEPLSGDTHMPKALGPAFGASERFAVSPGDEENAYLHMPAGQSGHPMSDYYRAGHDDWAKVRPSAFLPGSSVNTLRLEPSD